MEEKSQKLKDRQRAVQKFYTELGIEVVVPKPFVASNREYSRNRKKNKELFYRPSSSTMGYAKFMKAVGQGKHWTVVHKDRNRVKWEDAETGYWFWAEVAPKCPRVKTSWSKLITTLKRLISLEEYVIVWYMCCKAGETLDISTLSWTRTRYNFANLGESERLGALLAIEYEGWINIRWREPESLGVPYDDEGGRVAEVVRSVS
ncbi:MAG: hypothetical protein Q7S48_01155 [bacterium]|nr:hypothetical protein [bacterium]